MKKTTRPRYSPLWCALSASHPLSQKTPSSSRWLKTSLIVQSTSLPKRERESDSNWLTLIAEVWLLFAHLGGFERLLCYTQKRKIDSLIGMSGCLGVFERSTSTYNWLIMVSSASFFVSWLSQRGMMLWAWKLSCRCPSVTKLNWWLWWFVYVLLPTPFRFGSDNPSIFLPPCLVGQGCHGGFMHIYILYCYHAT